MRTRLLLMPVLLILFSSPSFAGDIKWTDSPEMAAIFREAGTEGTFVIYDAQRDAFTGCNRARAETRFRPASTFKVVNTLIGLSCGAVRDVDEVLSYGGQPQEFKMWEKDMSLRDAIKISSVPIYQELARRIGMKNMQSYVDMLGYGNRRLGSVVDLFWLDGPLEISPIEQTLFLTRLARQDLPLKTEYQLAVREIIKYEEGGGRAIFAKTGTAMRLNPAVGWWVGWVEKDGGIYSFAVNVQLPEKYEIGERIELAMKCLKAAGII